MNENLELENEEELTEEQKIQKIESIKKEKRKQYMTGKMLVSIIAVIIIITSLVNVFSDIFIKGEFLSGIIILSIRLYIAWKIYKGSNWARYFYAVLGILAVIISCFSLVSVIYIYDILIEYPIIIWACAVIFIEIVYTALVCSFLFFNKSIKEYLSYK